MFYQFQHFGRTNHFCKEYGDNFNFPMHLHGSYELIVVLSGSMDVSVNRKNYHLSANESVLVFPNQLHSLESQNCKHVLLIFSQDNINAFHQKTGSLIPSQNKFKISQYLLSEINALSEDSSRIKLKAVLYSICAEFDEVAAYVMQDPTDNNLLYRIFEFVEQNYKNDCSLENLAKHIGFGYSYLSRYFKSSVGISFNSYVNQYRISNACYLLKNSGNSILECALECGYTSLRSFNRNFKMYTLVSPKEYRDS